LSIYTITTIDIGDLSKGRCVGFFVDGAVAMEKVKNNVGDLHEAGFYTHAVIERYEEGIYPCAEDRIFFVWDEIKGKFVECEEPEQVKEFKLVNFGIG